MKSINLLPHTIEKCKQNRRLKISMAVLQVAIFLCIGVAILFLYNWEQRIITQSYNLAESIATFDERPLLLVAELEHARAIRSYFDDFFLANVPEDFNTLWVAAILETLPDNATPTQLNYNQWEIVLLGEAGNIADAQMHRQKLVDAGLFEYVSLNSITLLGNGIYSYELHIRVRQNEE